MSTSNDQKKPAIPKPVCVVTVRYWNNGWSKTYQEILFLDLQDSPEDYRNYNVMFSKKGTGFHELGHNNKDDVESHAYVRGFFRKQPLLFLIFLALAQKLDIKVNRIFQRRNKP